MNNNPDFDRGDSLQINVVNAEVNGSALEVTVPLAKLLGWVALGADLITELAAPGEEVAFATLDLIGGFAGEVNAKSGAAIGAEAGLKGELKSTNLYISSQWESLAGKKYS